MGRTVLKTVAQKPLRNPLFKHEIFKRNIYNTRHTANTSKYSLTFCVRVMSLERHHWNASVTCWSLISNARAPCVN